MNKRQKEVLLSQAKDEESVIKELEAVYRKALDSVKEKIAVLLARTDVQNIQSIIYQVNIKKVLNTSWI